MSTSLLKNDSCELTKAGEVFFLTMTAGENRFNPTFIGHLNDALDVVEKSEGAAALVTTSSDPKFYSNGLDLAWLAGNRSQAFPMLQQYEKLLARIVAFPLPTVAALNGHAVAAGGMLALAHDYRIMKDDRALFWMPEVDIKLPFSPGMSRILTEKLVDPQVIRDVMFFGKRYTSKEAFAAKIVDELVPADRVVARATEIVQNLAAKASDRATLKTIKEGVYRHLLPLLKEGPTPENHPAARKLAKIFSVSPEKRRTFQRSTQRPVPIQALPSWPQQSEPIVEEPPSHEHFDSMRDDNHMTLDSSRTGLNTGHERSRNRVKSLIEGYVSDDDDRRPEHSDDDEDDGAGGAPGSVRLSDSVKRAIAYSAVHDPIQTLMQRELEEKGKALVLYRDPSENIITPASLMKAAHSRAKEVLQNAIREQHNRGMVVSEPVIQDIDPELEDWAVEEEQQPPQNDGGWYQHHQAEQQQQQDFNQHQYGYGGGVYYTGGAEQAPPSHSIYEIQGSFGSPQQHRQQYQQQQQHQFNMSGFNNSNSGFFNGGFQQQQQQPQQFWQPSEGPVVMDTDEPMMMDDVVTNDENSLDVHVGDHHQQFSSSDDAIREFL